MSPFFRPSGRIRGRVLAAALSGFLAVAPVFAAPPNLPSSFVPITVDGSTSAWTTLSGQGQAFNVLFDGSTFHLWYRADANFGVPDLRHATSFDGINFTTVGGAFSFTGTPFPTGTPPLLYYDAVSVVGTDYKIIHWTSTGDAGTYPAYDYNNSVSNAGASPANTVLTHQGPMGGGTAGQTAGSFGIVSSAWYGQCGLTGQEVCTSPYTDGSPPNVAVSIYPSVLDASALFTTLGIPTGYINNHGDVQPGGGGLDMVFTVRDNAGSRFNQQVYYSGSSDGGATWTTPGGIIFGAPTITSGFGGTPNFAHPELIRTPTGGLLYVSTQTSDGNFVIAVSDGRLVIGPSVPVPALDGFWLALLASMLAFAGYVAHRRREARPR